jgi:hypothetical protein
MVRSYSSHMGSFGIIVQQPANYLHTLIRILKAGDCLWRIVIVDPRVGFCYNTRPNTTGVE